MLLLRPVTHSRSFAQRVLGRSIHNLKLRDAPVDIHPEVEEALAHNKPVVSLETALVTNGLPYPQSLEVPLSQEQIVRSTGAIPATIGLVGGRVKIGLEKHELERLADPSGKPVKISRRDIAAAIATGRDGGTTCSSTLIFSALAGIKVFATGGMGGVHKGGENSFDISADLQEIARCPVALVSSGVKSILDIKRTLEYLETLGVPVIPYNETRDFPAFFSPESGFKVPWSTSDPAIAAKILDTHLRLGLNSGIMFPVPIPEKYRGAGQTIQNYIDQAVQESEQNGMASSGSDVTPWLLNRVRELDGGLSLESNIALLENNALVGGQIAVHYQRLQGSSSSTTYQPSVSQTAGKSSSIFQDVTSTPTASQSVAKPQPAKVVVVGCAAIDVISTGKTNVNPALALHSTIPGKVALSLGGVARNIAEAATRVSSSAYPGLSPLLVAPVGKDFFGHILAEQTARLGMRNDGFVTVEDRTAVCNMVLDGQGGLIGGVADMDITNEFSFDAILPQLQAHTPEYVCFDGNLKADTLKQLVNYCHQHKIKSLFEPTSVYKTSRILPSIAARINEETTEAPISHFTPNLLELQEVFEQVKSEEYDLMARDWWWKFIDNLSLGTSFRMDLDQLARRPVDDEEPSKGKLGFLTEQGVAQMAVNLLPFFQHIWVKCGAQGVLVFMHIPPEKAALTGFASQRTKMVKRCIVAHGMKKDIVVVKHFPALKVDTVENVTGAGDSFVGTLVAGIASDNKRVYDLEGLDSLVNTAQQAAALTLQSHEAVSPLLSDLKRS